MKRLLICTDLDRTLLPNGSQPESPGARQRFARLAARPEITLAYVSGRHRELVEEAIRAYDLPVPDWVIGDVGTSLYRIENDIWQQWHAWESDIAQDWQGLTAVDLRPLFTDIAALRLQEENKQNRYKLSYYLPTNADTGTLQQEMARRLRARSIAASVIYSIDEAAGCGLLDVLPARATKRHAVEFLIRQQRFDTADTVFAGDSGNDLPVLVSTVPSVLVANASPEVAAQAQDQAARNGTQAALYLAQGGLFGMNGYYSAGILEGIVHYHPNVRQWLTNHEH